MDITTFLETYPDYCEALACASFLIFWVLNGITDMFFEAWYTSRNNREASRCLGFHSGQITGFCNCRSCPYHAQCQHYAPPATFKERLYRFGRRIKARFSR